MMIFLFRVAHMLEAPSRTEIDAKKIDDKCVENGNRLGVWDTT